MTDMTVAKTILEQLGGNRFKMMTGAHTFTGLPNGLSFRLPGGGGFCKNGVNFVRIILNAEDTYDIEFVKLRGVKFYVKAERKSIYAEDLRQVFTRETGIETNFGTMGVK